MPKTFHQIDASKAVCGLKMTIRMAGLKRFSIRFHLGLLILKLALWLLPFKAEAELGCDDHA